jgi:serine/threonine-protein kinase HipA
MVASVRLHGLPVGELTASASGALSFTYLPAFAAAVGLRRELVRDRLRAMATALPEQVRLLREGMRGSLADTPLLDQVVADVCDRCGRVAAWG